MPCYEVNMMSLELAAADWDLLKKAAAKVGETHDYGSSLNVYVNDKYGSAWFTVQNGKVTFNQLHENRVMGSINAMKREYSKLVVSGIAKQKGWSGKWKETEKQTIKATFGKW